MISSVSLSEISITSTLFGMIGLQDILAQPVEVDAFGIAERLNHRQVLAAYAVVDEFVVNTFIHDAEIYALCG